VLLLIIAALASLALLGLLVGASPRVQGWDAAVARSVADDASPMVGDFARTMTHLGDRNVYMALAAIVLVVLLALRRLRLAGFLVTVVVGQWVLTNWLKALVERERPDLNQLVSASGYAFPSGHASAAAATYLALALVIAVLRPRWNVRVLVAGAIAIGVVVAATRVFVGVHWTTDVLAGLAFGWAWCLLCAWLFRVRPVPLPSRTELGSVGE
jgi:undecaprenyl-diphosphatase